MKLLSLSLVVLAASVTSAQAAPQDFHPAPRPVAFYTANPGLRQATLARCLNDPGGLGKTPDCINAKAAESRAILNPNNQKMFKLKPLSER